MKRADPRLGGERTRESDAGSRTSLAVRITFLVVGSVIAVAAIAGVLGSALIRVTAANVTRTNLAGQADVLAGQLAGEEPGYRIGLSKLVQVFAAQKIAVVNLSPTNVVSGADRNAVRAAELAGLTTMTDGQSISASEVVNGKTELVQARRVGDRAFALVASPDKVAGTSASFQQRLILALAIGVAVAVIGGLVLARLVTRPLRRTAAMARAMGGGARDVRAPVAGPTEVAEVAVAVNELADALQHSESRQREFLTSVSHELRTPLAGINGQAQALMDGIVPADEVAGVGRLISAESARLARLVSDLLDLARLGADTFRLDPAPCDLGALIREMASMWQVRCDQHGVPMLVSVPPAPVVTVTDARRLRQVLDGLAENALRLLSPGRPLVLDLVSDLTGRPGMAVLQVRDGGPGLAPEDYPVAFEQGVLHDRYRGRRPGGAGLGLALAQSLVSRLGGRIFAGPAAEGGVAVTIELPLV